MKKVTFSLTENEYKYLEDVGDGNPNKGISQLIENSSKVIENNLVLPDDPIEAKVFKKAVQSAKKIDRNKYRINADVVLGIVSSTLGIPTEGAKNIIGELQSGGFLSVRWGTIWLYPEFRDNDSGDE